MKRYFCVLQAFIFSLLFIGCSNEDESASTPTVQASKTELFAIGTARMKRAASSPYLFTLDNIKSFNAQTREIIFQDFEPTSLLFPIYRNIEIHSYGKVLLHISTFVSSFNSQIFTDLSLVSESDKFYLSAVTHAILRTIVNMLKRTRPFKKQKKKERQNGESFSQYSKNTGS